MAEKFSIVDYVVFSIMLLISAAIGIWYGCGPGGKQKTTKEYLLADRKMQVVPVAISLLVSYLSAITLLGVPSEIYTYGAQYYVLVVSYFIICGVVGIVFVPMFRRINITCANEVSKWSAFFFLYCAYQLQALRQLHSMPD
jgi:Na+/proline symporter